MAGSPTLKLRNKKENQMNDDEIRKQNRDDLLERMSESGNAHSSEYPYGLMMEAEEEIKRLRARLNFLEIKRHRARLD